jgi:hypothetical protein
MIQLPRLISDDGRVIGSPMITDRLPSQYREVGPHVVRKFETLTYPVPDRLFRSLGARSVNRCRTATECYDLARFGISQRMALWVCLPTIHCEWIRQPDPRVGPRWEPR